MFVQNFCWKFSHFLPNKIFDKYIYLSNQDGNIANKKSHPVSQKIHVIQTQPIVMA